MEVTRPTAQATRLCHLCLGRAPLGFKAAGVWSGHSRTPRARGCCCCPVTLTLTLRMCTRVHTLSLALQVIFDDDKELKVLFAWNSNCVVVCFRGSTTAANWVADAM